MYNQEKYEQALDAFTKAINVAPPNWSLVPTVLGNRAATLVMMGRFIEACDDCQDALRLDASLVKLHVRRARSLLRLGHFSAVEEACTRVLECPPAAQLQSQSQSQQVSSDQEVEAAKAEARKCLKDLIHVRALAGKLSAAECTQEFESVLKLTEGVLEFCPQYRIAQVSRANALNRLQRWTTTKEFIEDIVSTVHDSVLRLHSHHTHTLPNAMAPKLSPDKLTWSEAAAERRGALRVDREEVLRALLIMGGDLAAVYMVSLKNVLVSRSCCGDVMAVVLWLTQRLKDTLAEHGGNNGLGTQSSGYDWAWVEPELARLQEVIDTKNRADQRFKESNFTGAIHSYGLALKADPTAHRWAAVLHSNRAAAYMSLSMFNEAVNDCNSAASRDPGYTRAYLRRARALRGLTKYTDAIRDYRKYLSSSELSSGGGSSAQEQADIEVELHETMELNSKHIRAEQMRQQRERFETESAFRSRGFGGSHIPRNPGRANFFEDDDDDDKFFFGATVSAGPFLSCIGYSGVLLSLTLSPLLSSILRVLSSLSLTLTLTLTG